MEVLAIIPARSGSKSVPHKNIREIAGKPMIAYSIEHGLKSKLVDRVIVSTDSQEYGNIAKKYGGEVPFIRPEKYATDTALDYDVFFHALTYLKEQEGYIPDIVVQLRPTYPIRNVEDIDKMIQLLHDNPEADSVRSIALAKEIPYKMWKKTANGQIQPLLTDIKECYNMPRQELPQVYYQNACIDVFRPRCIFEYGFMTGKHILGYEMTQNYDIDTEEEFMKASQYLQIMQGGKRFVFDIDGVIAQFDPSLDYANAVPNEPMVKVIQKLHQAGNEIVLFTARGYVTGQDWSDVTREQMKRFGVPFDELLFGKPNGDYYVDDKMMDFNLLLDLFGK